MKQLEVQIMGQSYLLGCPEGGEARLQEAATRVDAAMCKIRDAGKIKARDRIAVLAALNLAFDLSDRPPPAERDASPDNNDSTTVTDREPLTGLLERLDKALGEDGRLL